MSARRYRLTFTAPSGEVFDASAALEIGELGTISSSPESDLSILTHGDMAMNLDNSDGAIEGFLEGATTTDLYVVVLERERPDGTGWDRMFGGVLDLPYSLIYDDKAKTARVIAYSFTKQLERTPADTIRRTLATKTASINTDTSSLMFISGETADLEVGDVIRLNDGQTRAEFTVSRIKSATEVITTQPANGTFTSVVAEVITPFYHDKGPAELLNLIADEAGVDLNDANLGLPLADFPIATPYSRAGLNINSVPESLVPVGGLLTATFDTGDETRRKTSTGPTATWANGTTSNIPLLDWTPYHDTEPGTITSAMADLAVPDNGYFAPYHPTNHVYQTAGFGSARANLRRRTGGSTGSGTDLGFSSIMTAPFVTSCCVVDPVTVDVYLSYRNEAGDREFRYWDGAAFNTISLTLSGWLQILRYPPDDRLIVMVDDTTNVIRMWELPSRTRVATITWFNSTDIILAWTMRSWGDTTHGGAASKRWWTFLYERDAATWVAVYDARGSADGWSFVATYMVSPAVSPHTTGTTKNHQGASAFQTVMKTSEGEEYAVGHAGGEWFVLDTSYAGVIRYANFKDSSCAKAVRDVAVVINSVVHIDEFGVMTIRNRNAINTGDAVAEIETPITSIRQPISQTYRASVSVRGTSESGAAIEEIQGDRGDSARRVTVDSDLVTTAGMALACAITTLQFVSQIREQRDVSVEDDGTPLHVFDKVILDGKTWLVYKIETDLEMEVHRLTLLEMLA